MTRGAPRRLAGSTVSGRPSSVQGSRHHSQTLPERSRSRPRLPPGNAPTGVAASAGTTPSSHRHGGRPLSSARTHIARDPLAHDGAKIAPWLAKEAAVALAEA
jgi:hypothetical protein